MAEIEDFSKGASQRINRYFSESFKRKKVREIEKNVSTVLEVSREYEVSTTAVDFYPEYEIMDAPKKDITLHHVLT